ncbi:unnamed protein product, partial [Notodromas monacha]
MAECLTGENILFSLVSLSAGNKSVTQTHVQEWSVGSGNWRTFHYRIDSLYSIEKQSGRRKGVLQRVQTSAFHEETTSGLTPSFCCCNFNFLAHQLQCRPYSTSWLASCISPRPTVAKVRFHFHQILGQVLRCRRIQSLRSHLCDHQGPAFCWSVPHHSDQSGRRTRLTLPSGMEEPSSDPASSSSSLQPINIASSAPETISAVGEPQLGNRPTFETSSANDDNNESASSISTPGPCKLPLSDDAPNGEEALIETLKKGAAKAEDRGVEGLSEADELLVLKPPIDKTTNMDEIVIPPAATVEMRPLCSSDSEMMRSNDEQLERDEELIKAITGAKKNLACKNGNGDTLSQLAERLEKPEIIEALFERDPVQKNKAADSPLKTEQNEPFPSTGFYKGNSLGAGDCFFDAFAQGIIKQHSNKSKAFEFKENGESAVRKLRQDCFNFISHHRDTVDEKTKKTWQEIIAKDAKGGGYISTNEPGSEQSHFVNYLLRVRLTAAEIMTNPLLGPTIWGRPEIEGRILCGEYGVKLHVIEKHEVDNQLLFAHQLIGSNYSKSIDEKTVYALYNEPNVIHIINEGRNHFEPVLPSSPADGEKQVLTLPYSGESKTPSQENPERIIQAAPSVDEKNNQFLAKYSKQFNSNQRPKLAEDWSETIDEAKANADFKILKISTDETLDQVLEFMQQDYFCQTCQEATH